MINHSLATLKSLNKKYLLMGGIFILVIYKRNEIYKKYKNLTK